MKKIIIAVFVCGFLITNNSFAQEEETDNADSTGLAGDHFSLQGALEMFKKSTSLEDFETKLNAESNYVNNLDLNEDNQTDYVSVNDIMEGNTHALVLKVAVNDKEWQDIAVIEVNKDGDKSALLQIVGDNELYGDSVIVEPFDEAEIKDKGGKGYGPDPMDYMVRRVVVNVWFWPCVQFMFAPAYVVWVSPWYWNHYPGWWKPWHVRPWRWHNMHCENYGMYHRFVHYYRIPMAQTLYGPRRSVSTVVRTRYVEAHRNYRSMNSGGRNMNTNRNDRREAGKMGKEGKVNHRQNPNGNSNSRMEKGARQRPDKMNGGRQKSPKPANNQRGGGKAKGGGGRKR